PTSRSPSRSAPTCSSRGASRWKTPPPPWRAGQICPIFTSPWLLLLHPQDPVLESCEELGEELARGLVGELALGELGGRHADEHLRPRQRIGPQLHEYPAQVVLHPRAAQRPRRAREHRRGLVLERLVGRARGPVDCVLERCGQG